MITFETLRSIEHGEKKGGLGALPEGFAKATVDYLASLEKDSLEYRNATNVLEEIYNARCWKILKLSVSDTPIEAEAEKLLPHEGELLREVGKLVRSYRAGYTKVKKEKGKVRVRFLKDFPRFVGIDTADYGPFKKGDEAELPSRNAKMLAEKSVGEEL